MANKFEHYVKKAVVWLVREHNFFRELKFDLYELKQDIERAKQEKEVSAIKRALRDSKYLSKAEMRFWSSEKILEQMMIEALANVDIKEREQIEEIRKALHKEARNLLLYSHRFEGKIIYLLHQLHVRIKHNEIEKAQKALMELQQSISNADEWIGALYTQLKLAEKIANKSGLAEFNKNSALRKVRDIYNQIERFNIKGTEVSIEPLSYKTLRGAINLANRIFPLDTDSPESPALCFNASLASWRHMIFFKKTGVSYLRYWVARAGNNVVGIIGLYTYKKDENEAVWIGWFCVDPKFQGIGIKLYYKFLREASKFGKTYVRLYTSTDPTTALARRLYEKLGFKVFHEEPTKWPGIKYIYLQLKIK